MTISSGLRSASFAMLCVAALGVAHPAQASVHGVRAWGGSRQVDHAGATFRNGQGGITHARGTRASGPNGRAAHGAYTSVNPDGSVKHQGATKVGSTTGSNGTVTHGSTIQGADGDTYTGQTSYTKGQGVTHTGSCTDASGAAITCAH